MTKLGRCENVKVIDRGPYIAGREFDLTIGTARRIHFCFRVGFCSIYVRRGWQPKARL